jgi:hypothetical protein
MTDTLARQSRTLTYRFERVPSYYQAIAFSVIFLLAFGFLAVRNQILGLSVGLSSSIIALLITSAFGIVALIVLLLKSKAKSSVHVTPESITIDTSGKKTEIKLSDIKSVKLKYSLNGWCKLITQSGETHKFTMALERSEYILEALRRINPEVLSEADFNKYRAKAIISDHCWARIFGRVLNIKKIIFKYILFNAILSAGLAYSLKNSGLGLNIVSIGMLVFLGLLVISMAASNFIANFTEYHLIKRAFRRIKEDPSYRVRDMAYEAKVEKIGDLVYALFLLSLLGTIIIFLR